MVVGVLHFFLILFLGLTRHWSYLTSDLDLGVYDQSLWGILNGHPFLNTTNELDQPINRLGVQFNPLVAIFAPLYAIRPAAEWLVAAQALAISITAWPLYLVGLRISSSERASMYWGLVYLLNPFVLNAAAWDFHAIVLAAPVMALTALAMEGKNKKAMLAGCVLLLLIREHLGIAVAGFGALWWIRHRTLPVSLFAIGLGSAFFVLVLGFIMPALSPTGSHVMITQHLDNLSRYGWLGTSFTEVMGTLFRNPLEAGRIIFFELEGWSYLFFLLVPLAVTPLVGAEFLLPALGDLAANMLSENPLPRSVFSYHSIAIVPLLVIAGMKGARRLSRFERYTVAGLGRLALVATLLMSYRLLPLPLPGAVNVWEPAEYRVRPERAVGEMRALLPGRVSVSAQANVAPHFTQRHSIRTFPRGVGETDCIVLRLASPTLRVRGDDPGEVGSLAHHLQMAPVEFLSAARRVIESGEYGVRYWMNPWLVACRGIPVENADRQGILVTLDEVARQWAVPAPSMP